MNQINERNRKIVEATAELVRADEARLQELRDAEVERGKRIDAAHARGETNYDELPTDPEALMSVTMTSSPQLDVRTIPPHPEQQDDR